MRVASEGGPEGRPSAHAATGVIASAPTNAPNWTDRSLAPICSPMVAVSSTKSSQPKLRGGPEKCTKQPTPNTTAPSHGARAPNVCGWREGGAMSPTGIATGNFTRPPQP